MDIGVGFRLRGLGLIGFNIGSLIITNTILSVPHYHYSIAV